MQLFMVKTTSSDFGTNWFLVAAEDEEEIREMCADEVTSIDAIISDVQDIVSEVRHEFDRVALIANV